MGNPLGKAGKSFSESSANALALQGLHQYDVLKGALLGDPLLQQLSEGALKGQQEILNMDFLGLGKTAATRQADVSAQGIRGSLAGRGGGGLGTAVGVGAQSRVGAGTQGMLAGLEAQKGYSDVLAQSQNLLAQALVNKYNLLTQLYAKQMGVTAPYLGFQGQLASGQMAGLSNIWGSALGGFGQGVGQGVANKYF